LGRERGGGKVGVEVGEEVWYSPAKRQGKGAGPPIIEM